MVFLAIAFGLVIGLAIGTFGGGGSVLAVPVLVYVFGQSVSQATTASLLIVTAAAVAGAAGYARAGRVCWRHAGTFTAAALPGVVAGTYAGEAIDDSFLVGAFALVMIAAAVATWRKADDDSGMDDGTWEGGGACPPLRMPRDLAAGIAVGFLTGFLGVGGGFLIVPTLAVALAFTMRTAIGTSLGIITATSVLGLATHLAAGRNLDLDITLAMAAACAFGALGGVAAGARLPQQDLSRGFALLVLAVAGYLLVSVAFLGGPTSG